MADEVIEMEDGGMEAASGNLPDGHAGDGAGAGVDAGPTKPDERAEGEVDAGCAVSAKSDVRVGAQGLAPDGSGGRDLLPSAGNVEIRDLIYTVRGVQVMLDSDLALLYRVETKSLNRAAKRNEDRFPEDFRFQITREEYDNLKCQIGTSWDDQREFGAGGRRYMPYMYSEEGVAMLSSVLRSKVAAQVSVRIMRAFVEMRHFIAGNAAMFEQIRAVELRQLEYQRTTDERFERVFDYVESREAPRQKVFLDGQVYDAFELLVSLVRRATESIVLIDGYVDVATLNILAKKADGVAVTVYTKDDGRLTEADAAAFGAQNGPLEVRRTGAFHDRFLMLDGAEGYHVGASLKDAGRKCFALTRIEDPASVAAILDRASRA